MWIFAALPALGSLFGIGGGAAAGAGAAAGGLGSTLSALGAITSAVGGVASGIQQNRVADYNAKVASNNAMAEQQRAAYDAGLIRDDKRRVIGTQRAAQAANGLMLSGSPVAVLGDTSGQAELDVLARLYGGDSSASAERNNARLQRASGKAAMGGAILGAGTTLLTGLGDMAVNRQRMRLGV